jgi:hypothetical protein
MPSAASLGFGGTQAATAVAFANQEIAYGEMSLCVAEHLAQQLDTAQVAFASGDDLSRVQEIVRERSLTAVYEYSMLAKTFATTAAFPTTTNDWTWWLPALLLWRNQLSSTSFTRFGDDFAEAIKLLADSTEASIEYKLRDPAGQTSFGTPQWSGTAFNGLSGPRADVIERILYEGYDDSTATIKRRAVQTDMSAPQVTTLLGLARNANALKLHVNGSPQFVSASNASALLLAVENFVRNNDCLNAATPAGSCVLATSSTPLTGYVIWTRYGISLSHAQTLVDGLTEALFGPPTPASRATGQWSYPALFTAATGVSQPAAPAEQLGVHVLGQHTFTGAVTSTFPTGDITIDPAFKTAAPRAIDIQSTRPPISLPVRDVNPNARASAMIGRFRFNPLNSTDVVGYPTDRRQVGSNTALALARESLLQLSLLSSGAKQMYTEAAPAVTLIEKMIGPRQVILRQRLKTTAVTSVCPTCVQVSPDTTVASGITTSFITADVIAKSTDTYKNIAFAQAVPLAGTLTMNSNTKTLYGQTQANAIANLTYTAMTPTAFGTTGYVLMPGTGSWLSSWTRGLSVILKNTAATPEYDHVYTGIPNNPVYGPTAAGAGTVVTFGGRFETELNRAWQMDQGRWDTPAYDGFGLPKTWNPAPDASLVGDAPGVSIEHHFLERATTAAEESAAALQQSFDVLQQQALDDATLLSSDAKAKSITALQYKSLCGTKLPSCGRQYVTMAATVPPCTPTNTTCENFRTDMSKIVAGGVPNLAIATPVSTEITAGNPAPTFDAYFGGSLQGQFVTQWNAWQALQSAMKTGVANVNSATAAVTTAISEVTAAEAEYTQVKADIDLAYMQLAANKTMYTSQLMIYEAQLAAAKKTMVDIECSTLAFYRADAAGEGYSGDDNLSYDANKVNHVDNKSFSEGPRFAQLQACDKATAAYNTAVTVTAAQKMSIDAQLKLLEPQLPAQAGNPLSKRKAAADARRETAYWRQAAAQAAVESTAASALGTVQAAMGQLLLTITNIDEAYTQSDIAVAKTAIEQQQTSYDIRTRFGVRARYHNYDLWRARALTENARRLALAARRAIESRYVVDLSTLNAPEPFVDSPSLWADQIYSSDLKPFSIGLTSGPANGSGIYTSAVKDYVSNLKLFLDGFTVQRPSAAVLSDAEVIQIPAPGQQVASSSFSSSFVYLDPRSSGWSFYCPGTDTWIAHPDSSKWSLTSPVTWTLATACGGSAPTLARYRFDLDPWGRVNGWVGNAPYNARYNVRLRNVALNLVGSGIRSCQKVADPSACYAEPFIRYDLKHVGPAWITSYDNGWRSLDIPKAYIEAGKALATEEWLDPVSNGFNRSDVSNVARMEFVSQPIGGAYELTLRLTPDVNVERIERIQLLAQTEYWVRQQ